jgi:hypothetical protein
MSPNKMTGFIARRFTESISRQSTAMSFLKKAEKPERAEFSTPAYRLKVEDLIEYLQSEFGDFVEIQKVRLDSVCRFLYSIQV